MKKIEIDNSIDPRDVESGYIWGSNDEGHIILVIPTGGGFNIWNMSKNDVLREACYVSSVDGRSLEGLIQVFGGVEFYNGTLREFYDFMGEKV